LLRGRIGWFRGVLVHEHVPLRPEIGIPTGGLDPDDHVQAGQTRLAEPKDFPQYPPGPIPIDCPGQYLFRYHQTQTGIRQAILAKKYVQTGTPLDPFETKNG